MKECKHETQTTPFCPYCGAPSEGAPAGLSLLTFLRRHVAQSERAFDQAERERAKTRNQYDHAYLAAHATRKAAKLRIVKEWIEWVEAQLKGTK